MTVSPHMPDEVRARRPRRFIIAATLIAVLLLIFWGVGLMKSINAHRALCPPSNPDCGFLPPTAPAATPLPR
jgi:hypothetical protein